MNAVVRFLGALGLGWVLLGSSAFAAVYYVDASSGNDGGSGAFDQPWRTIQKAADSLAPGDTAMVRGGIYFEQVTLHVSGSASAFVTLQNYPGETPIIDGANIEPPRLTLGLVHIENRSFVIVSGFEIRNFVTEDPDAVPAGIYVAGACRDIQLIGNNIHHIQNNYAGTLGKAFGIAVYGTTTRSIKNLVVDGNELSWLNTGGSESLTLNGNVENFRVSRNRLHDNNNIGICFVGFEQTCPNPAFDQTRNGVCSDNVIYDLSSYGNPAMADLDPADQYAASGIYVDGGAGITLERNRVSRCDLGIEVSSELYRHYARSIRVRDNAIDHCRLQAISVGGFDLAFGWAQDCAFTNNTTFHDDTLGRGHGELTLLYSVKSCVFKYNIFCAGSDGVLLTNPFQVNSGNSLDHNLYFTPASSPHWQWRNGPLRGFAGYKSASGQDAHSLFADPLFVSTGDDPDLHLQAGSPAIDRGPTKVGNHETDCDNAPRLVGPRVDLGAFERQ